MLWHGSLLRKHESRPNLKQLEFPSVALLNLDTFQQLSNNCKMEHWSVFPKWRGKKKKAATMTWHAPVQELRKKTPVLFVIEK